MSNQIHSQRIYDIPRRNTLAATVISKFANRIAEIAIETTFSNNASLIGELASQFLFQSHIQSPNGHSLIQDLSLIYLTTNTENLERYYANKARRPTLPIQLWQSLYDEINQQILPEIKLQLLEEIDTWSVDVVGSLDDTVSPVLAASLAHTLAWRVGTMIVMYYQNGCRWINGSSHDAYQYARELVDGLSPVLVNRVNLLNEISARNLEVFCFQLEQAIDLTKTVLGAGVVATEKLQEMLRTKGFAEPIIEKTLAATLRLRQHAGEQSAEEGIRLQVEKSFAEKLFRDLTGRQEEDLLELADRLDKYRDAIRQRLETVIIDYVQNRNPAKLLERQLSVDLINSLMKRLGFALEHPDHPGRKCYLTLSVDSGQPQGQIRLLAEGSASKPIDRSAHLSNFAYLHVIDATVPIEMPPSHRFSDGISSRRSHRNPSRRG